MASMPRTGETILLTALALLAFAANSILTRLALAEGHIDAATFTVVRLGAGALMLTALVFVRVGGWGWLRGAGARGPVALFAYAAPFSFAYLRIGAALGALVLFGAVQLTMLAWGIVRGERPGPRSWIGMALAVAGLAWLTLPSARRPDPLGMTLMVLAGISWGVYTIAGKTAGGDPLALTARNFVYSVPLATLLVLLTKLDRPAFAQSHGVILAAISGAVTSGLGYTIWYRALRGLSSMQAAVLQLSVPVIAALGAVLILGEALHGRLVGAGLAVLGGVALTLSSRSKG
jgi:drug/metabolite transporter (DMT)-like permease